MGVCWWTWRSACGVRALCERVCCVRARAAGQDTSNSSKITTTLWFRRKRALLVNTSERRNNGTTKKSASRTARTRPHPWKKPRGRVGSCGANRTCQTNIDCPASVGLLSMLVRLLRFCFGMPHTTHTHGHKHATTNTQTRTQSHGLIASQRGRWNANPNRCKSTPRQVQH